MDEDQEVSQKQSREWFKTLKDIALGVAFKKGGAGAVEVVTSIINSMDKTLKVLDKYLAQGKEKAKDALVVGKDMAKSYGAKAKTKGKEVFKSFGEKGVLQTAKDEAGSAKQGIANMFKRKEPEPEDPDADPNTPSAEKKGLLSTIGGKLSSAYDNLKITDEKLGEALIGKFEKAADKKAKNFLKQNSVKGVDDYYGDSTPLSYQSLFNHYYDDQRKELLKNADSGNPISKKLLTYLEAAESKRETDAQEQRPDKDKLDSVIDSVVSSSKSDPTDLDKSAKPSEDKPKEDPKADDKPKEDTKDSEISVEKIEESKEKKSLMGMMKDTLNVVQEAAKKLTAGKEEVDPKEAARAERKKETQEALDMQKVRNERRSKEIEDEKNSAKIKKDEKGKGGIFNAILSSLGGILGAVGGVSTAITAASKFLLGGFAKFLPGLIWKGVKLLPKAIGVVLSGIMGSSKISDLISRKGGKLLKRGGKALWSGAKALGRRAISSTALRAAGQIALRGASMVGGALAFKVILAASVIYGGYKLYKYLTRNNIGSGTVGTMTRLRLLSYGYAEVNREHYHKLLEFDMLMKDYVSKRDGKAIYKQFDKPFKDKVLELFEVKYDDKKKYGILNDWFINRYLVAHKAFMDAYYGCGGADYIDNLEKLSGDQVFNFASAYTLPTSVHDTQLIPVFDNPKSVVTKEEIDVLIASMRQGAKKDSEQYKDKSAEEVQRENQKKINEEAAVKKSENDRLAQIEKDKLEKAKAETKKTGTDDSTIAGSVPPQSGGSSEMMGPPNPNATSEVAGPPASAATPGPLGHEIDKTANNTTGAQAPVPHAEGEPKPQITPADAAKSKEETPLQSTVDKVAKAPGPIIQDNPNLEGIRANVPMSKVHRLDPNMKKLLAGMAKEYKDLTGKNILVTEAFRTREDQIALKKKYGDRAAAPGKSLHEFGIAVDINSPDADALDKMGLMRKYGFTRPIGGERWHLEPSGVATNPSGAKHDIALRDRLINASVGKGGGGIGANPNTPKSMKYRRDIAGQKKIFGGDPGLEVKVDPAKKAPKDSKPEIGGGVIGGITDTDQKDFLTSSGGGTVKSPDGSPVRTGSDATSASPIDGKTKDSPVTDLVNSGLAEGEPPPKNTGPLNDVINKTKEEPVASNGTIPAASPVVTKSQTPVSPTAPKGLDTKPSENITTAQSNLNPGEYVNLSPEQAVIQASKVVGMDPNTMLTFAKIESSMGAGATNSKSSAQGLFQIVGPTWRGLMKKYGAKYNIPPNADRSNPYYNSVLGVAYAKENYKKLKGHREVGIPDDIALYIAHHYGSEGGNRIFRAAKENSDASMQSAVSEDSYKSNLPELRGKTIAQYIEYLKNKFAKAGSTPTAAYGGSKGAKSSVGTSTTQKESSEQASYVSKSSVWDSTDQQEASEQASAEYSSKSSSTQTPTTPSSSQTSIPNSGGMENTNVFDYNETGFPKSSTQSSGLQGPPSLPTGEVSAPVNSTQPNVLGAGFGSKEAAMRSGIEAVPQAFSKSINDITLGIKGGIGGVNSALQRRLDSIAPMGSTPGGIVPAQPRTGFEDLSKSQTEPVSIAASVMRQRADQAAQPQQPSQALSLDKTESLLSNMGDTLLQIKGILQSIHDKPGGGMGSDKKAEQSPQQQTSEKPPIKPPLDRTPSGSSVSMSRRSLTS